MSLTHSLATKIATSGLELCHQKLCYLQGGIAEVKRVLAEKTRGAPKGGLH